MDSPNTITSGPKFTFTTSAPSFNCESKYSSSTTELYTPKSWKDGVIIEGTPVPITNVNYYTTGDTEKECWSVTATLNGITKQMYKGDEWVINDNFKITLDDVFSGIRGGALADNYKVDYSFYIDESQISAGFEDPFPLVEFKEQHREKILITNKILDFDGGFLVNKMQQTFYTSMEGWMEHSKDGIPLGLSEAYLIFPIWDLGDNQYKVIPYIHFLSTKSYQDPECLSYCTGDKPDTGCGTTCPQLSMTTLDKYLTSPIIAEKTTRTLVGQTDQDRISIITVTRNNWMKQFPSLYYEDTPIKELSIDPYVDAKTATEEKGKLSTAGGIAIIIFLVLSTAGIWYLLKKRKKR